MLVNKPLAGDGLLADLDHDLVVVAFRGKGQRMVAAFVIGRCHLVAVAVLVVVGFRRCTSVRQANVLARDCCRKIGAPGVAVAAIKRAGLSCDQGSLSGRRVFRRRGIHENRPADAVASDANRCDPGEDLDAPHIGRVDVGECRVHVVCACRGGFQAIDPNLHAIICQTVNDRQAGNATRTVEAQAGDVLEKARRVAGTRAQRGKVRLVQARF